MPFDGSIHPYKSVCALIKSDFEDYLLDIKFSNDHFANTKYHICWNHEKTRELESFKEQNTKRVEQFKNALLSSKSIMFILHLNNKSPDYNVDELINVIASRYPALKFHLFVFNNLCKEYRRECHGQYTYLSLYWDPPGILHENLGMDFIIQMYKTEYGIYYSQRVLEEFCVSLDEDMNKYFLDKSYNFDKELK